MENDLKAIRHYGNMAISRKDFGFNQWDCHAFARNDSRSVLPSRQLGFTLAEILIVLTIIGVMAVMTIPSLMQNANSQHKIAMFKKAFNAVSNAYATEFAIKSAPKNGSGYRTVFDALNNHLNIKYYYNSVTSEKTFNKPSRDSGYQYYIITEDGIAYKSTSEQGDLNSTLECKSMLETNAERSPVTASDKHVASDKLYKNSCVYIIVDIEGIKNNKLGDFCDDDADLNKLNNCSRIRFYVTKSGITAGNPDCTISGRIMNDNTTYDSSKCIQ